MMDISIHDVKRIKITKPEERCLNGDKENLYYTRRMQIFDKKGTQSNLTLFAHHKIELEFEKIS